MRVLHVLHSSLPFVSGYTIRSSYILRLQKQGGIEVLAVTSGRQPSGEAGRETLEAVEYRRTSSPRTLSWPLWREWRLMGALESEVARAVVDWCPDLIHAHSPVLVSLPALRVARRHNLPFVYEVRDLWENASVDRGRFADGSLLYRLARRLDSIVLSRADSVVTICEALRAELAPRAPHASLHVVANGVDVEGFSPRPPCEATRVRHGLLRKRVVLYVGAFEPYEGLELLVSALPRVLSSVPDAHLVIVGGSASQQYAGACQIGIQEQTLSRQVAKLGLESHVTLTGRVPHSDVAGLYSIAEVVVYPRLLTRTTALTTPLKPLEAMSMGRPVVVSDLPPMRELVRDGDTGLTFPAGEPAALADRCLELLTTTGLGKRLGGAARAFVVAERQWPALVGQYHAIYRELQEREGALARRSLASSW